MPRLSSVNVTKTSPAAGNGRLYPNLLEGGVGSMQALFVNTKTGLTYKVRFNDGSRLAGICRARLAREDAKAKGLTATVDDGGILHDVAEDGRAFPVGRVVAWHGRLSQDPGRLDAYVLAKPRDGNVPQGTQTLVAAVEYMQTHSEAPEREALEQWLVNVFPNDFAVDPDGGIEGISAVGVYAMDRIMSLDGSYESATEYEADTADVDADESEYTL